MKRIIKLLFKILLVAVIIVVVLAGLLSILGGGFFLLQQAASPNTVTIVILGTLATLVLAMATWFVFLDEKDKKASNDA